MIEKIEFSVEGQKNSNTYNREEYLLYLKRSKKEDFGIHRVKSWINDGKTIVTEYLGGTPSYFWDSIIKRIDSNKIIILNPDASIRFIIAAPEELIQWEEYEKHFGFDKSFKRQDYSMNFERLDNYFEYQGKYYLKVLIALTNKNNSFYSYTQMRYLNSDTGEFLPFTNEITRITPNQYAYNQETINL